MGSSQGLVLALDQGTTSSRAVAFDKKARIRAIGQSPFKQYYPHPGWVEHDALEILSSQLAAITEALVVGNIDAKDICCMGITNQRETTVLWNRSTGMPIAPAIVWQCTRTAQIVEELVSDSAIYERIRKITGLVPDAYFSASKIKWLLDKVPGARELAEQGELAFGTIDSWLIWQLTNGAVHATDYTNASRTMLYNIHECCWDPWLLDLFDVPTQILPTVQPSASHFGDTAHPSIPHGIPIYGVTGDQQAALFGHACFNPGDAKTTFGTGCFFLVHTGTTAPLSQNKLITTIAASAPGTTQTEYALEGSTFVSGALIQWLRDEMGLVKSAAQAQRLAQSVPDTAGVHVVPAFTGLGAPYWDKEARGAVLGITRGTNKAHIVRAAHEAMAFQLSDLIEAVRADTSLCLKQLRVDGGGANNDFLLQFQSDILNTQIVRPSITEITSLGAAFLAGLNCGFWESTDELTALVDNESCTVFTPSIDIATREDYLSGWKQAIARIRTS